MFFSLRLVFGVLEFSRVRSIMVDRPGDRFIQLDVYGTVAPAIWQNDSSSRTLGL